MVYATQNGFHAKQASNREPCLSCGESDWCYLISDPTGDIYRIICGRTPADSAPEGWRYYGQSTDNRQKFIRSDYRRRRQSKKYPARVELAPQPKHDIPQWQDVPAPPLSEVKKGHLVILKPEVSLGNLSQVYQIIDLKLQKSTGTLRATLQSAGDIDSTTITVDLKDIKEVVCRDDKGREQFIEYIYAENLKVVRTQWSDRRPVYQGKQTKKVRPWHINKDGKWTEGKGDIDFPLYHQDEAEEAINNGGIVFVAPGEQAVEAARSLGLTATYCIGGEKNVRTIATKLSPTFQNVSRLREADAGDTGVDGESVGMANCKPLLVYWADNDKTGYEANETFQKECRLLGIITVAIDPISLWPGMPPKGDIIDWLNHCRANNMSDEEIIFRLTEAVEEAIDAAEEDAKYRNQRYNWFAPVSHNGEIGFWRKEKDGSQSWEPCCNFDFQVESELKDSSGGGLVLQVKRSFEDDQHQIILNSCDYTSVDKFADSLKKAIGTGISCNLNKYQLNALIHTRLHEYRTNRKGKVYRRIECYGQQRDGTWVFRDRQYTKFGKPTTTEESGWVFNPNLGIDDYIPCPEQADPNTNALKTLVDASRLFFGERNIYQVLLMIGWSVAGIHSQEIFAHDRCFPVFNGYGEPGSCKTLAAETALSLIGKNWSQAGMLARVTTSALYEHASRTGSLPFFWDDPERKPENEELAKNFYNRKARKVRGNEQIPISPLGITSNHLFGGEQAATYTRMARAAFDKAVGGNKEAFQMLKAAQEQASGAFPLLLEMGYDATAIADIERELLGYLPQAHARIAQSLAIVTYYAEKIIQLTNGSENIIDWVIKNLCSSENDADNSADSLQDFVEKILALESESLVGDWNLNKNYIDASGKRWVAIHYSNVWSLVDTKFKPATYNQKSLKALVLKAGGRTDTTVRLAKSRDEVLAFYRALVQGDEPIAPESKPCKAWLLPAKLFPDDTPGGGDGGDGGNGGNSPPSPTPVTSVTSCNQNPVTAGYAYTARVSAPSDPPCNHVTKKNEEERNETKKAVVNFGPCSLESKNPTQNISLVTSVTTPESPSVTELEAVTKNRLQTVTAVTHTPEEEAKASLQIAADSDEPDFLEEVREIYLAEILREAAKSLTPEQYAKIMSWVTDRQEQAAASTDSVRNQSPVAKFNVGDRAKVVINKPKGSDQYASRRSQILSKYHGQLLTVSLVNPTQGVTCKDEHGESTSWLKPNELELVKDDNGSLEVTFKKGDRVIIDSPVSPWNGKEGTVTEDQYILAGDPVCEVYVDERGCSGIYAIERLKLISPQPPQHDDDKDDGGNVPSSSQPDPQPTPNNDGALVCYSVVEPG